jgi:DNA (cytosine-5)-methyltransferase 1
MLPTPVATDWKNGEPGKGFTNLKNEMRMLPTPRAQEPGSTSEGYGNGLRETVRMLPNDTSVNWEQFEQAIRRWESTIGRAAPAPLIDNRLNPKFTEWLMGLPDGWITDLDISWTQMIKACGNGVVPQQAKLALERLIP